MGLTPSPLLKDIMNDFQYTKDIFTALIRVLAMSSNMQVLYLKDLPHDIGAMQGTDSLKSNSLVCISEALSFFCDKTLSEGDGTFSPDDSLLAELVTAIDLVDCRKGEQAWTQAGLRQMVEWQIVRRLAGIILSFQGDPGGMPSISVDELIESISI